MKLTIIQKSSKVYKSLLDSFIHNSLFIMLSSITGAIFGLVFWILAAKYYSPEQVGIATALISSMGLLVHLSKLGLDFSIIRFFPDSNKSKLFSTSIIITTIVVVFLGVFFILSIDFISAQLGLLKTPLNALFFLIILAINSITVFFGVSFIALRRAKYHSLQSLITGSRLIFLIPLIGSGAIGIFNSVGLSFLISFLVSLILIKRMNIDLKFVIDRSFLKKSFNFSAGNYLANLFMLGPTTILPILILNTLGAESAAYYFIAYSIASILHMIPNSAGLSLFVEGSNGENVKRTVIKSLSIIYLLLIPSILVLYFFGGNILRIVSLEYSTKSIELLELIVLSYIFQGINYTYFAIKRIQKSIKVVVIVNGLYCFLLIVSSYLFMLTFGLTGVGYAWIISNGLLCSMIVFIVWKEGWFKELNANKNLNLYSNRDILK